MKNLFLKDALNNLCIFDKSDQNIKNKNIYLNLKVHDLNLYLNLL
jgi:hypothetical protein